MASVGSPTLTADQIRSFGVTFGTVEERTLETEVRAVGVIAFDETRVSQVASKVGGFVERLYVDFTGEAVQRGQALLELYSPDLVAAQQELLLAAQLQRTVDQSPVPGFPSDPANLVAAAKRRFALWDISSPQVEEILRTGRVRRTLTLHAPRSGVVVEKKVVSGQSVMPGDHLYTVADLSRVWIEAELRDADAANVRVGSVARIEIAGLPGRSLSGRVEYIYPTVQLEARTIRARVAVSNGDATLKPGMYATVRLSTPGQRVLAIPASGVVRTGERAIVFVDMGGGELMSHEVTVGRVVGEYIEVLGGLSAGDRVVTSAQFLIDSESNLADVMRSMIGQAGTSDVGETQTMPGMRMPGVDQGPESSGAKVPSPPAPRR
jgi:Cu(I)/Ag(I) efflux system membrane fusion protein